MGVTTSDVKPAMMLRLQTSGSGTKRLDRREMTGSGADSSWDLSSPNNFANVRTTMGDGLSTVICPSISASIDTISDINGGQVDFSRSAREGLRVGAIGMGAGAAVAGAGARGSTATVSIAKP